jgi:hypothetical protein
MEPSKGRGPDGWIETKTNEAKKLGEILGHLQGLGVISVVNEDPKSYLFELVDLPPKFEKMTPKKRARTEKNILAAFSRGIEEGLVKSREEDEEEEGDDDEEDDEE